MKKLAYEDWELRDFFRYTKDPIEQVFICAELCLRPPEIMLEKVLALNLIDNATAQLVVTEIEIRKYAEEMEQRARDEKNRLRREQRQAEKGNKPKKVYTEAERERLRQNNRRYYERNRTEILARSRTEYAERKQVSV